MASGEIPHGSSLDVRADEEIPKEQRQSVGLALVQKKAMFTFCRTANLDSVIKFKSMEDYYDHQSVGS